MPAAAIAPLGVSLAAALAAGCGTGNGPDFYIADTTVAESAATVTLTVTRAGSTASAATVDYATADGTATAGADFTAASGTLTFSPGETSKDIVITLADDALNEGDQSFTVTLSNPTNGSSIAVGTATVTLTDNDQAPRFSIAPLVVALESDNAMVTVTKTGDSEGDATVNYAAADGTAVAGVDYTGGTGTLTFAKGVTTKAISVNLTDNAVFEPTKSFTIVLTKGDVGTVDSSADTATVFIADDDPIAAIVAPSVLDGAVGATVLGESKLDHLGDTVGNAGDINGDGFDDFLFRVPGAEFFYDESRVAVVFGRADWTDNSGVTVLSDLDGSNGIVLNGATGEGAGYSASGAGDVNGDGYADIIIGAGSASPNGDYSGAAYVVFGKADWSANGGVIQLASLDGTDGFVLNGVAVNDEAGYSVSGAGDVNGDGFADVIVGAFGADPNGDNSGAAYVVFGKEDWSANGGVVELSALDGGSGFVLNGVGANHRAGGAVSGAGDVNGDGYADVIVGATNVNFVTFSYSGAAYVVFGKGDWSTGFTGSAAGIEELSALNGANGFVLNGVQEFDNVGSEVAGAGDVNGDGFADVILGSRAGSYPELRHGTSYVVFGKEDWSTGFTGSAAGIEELSALDGDNGFLLLGTEAYAFFYESGSVASGAGDVNGDGFDDVIIGAHEGGSNIGGSAFVVFGKADWTANGGMEQLADLDGTNGFSLEGQTFLGDLGRSVAGGGDVNGDGFADVVVGAPSESPEALAGAGAGYLIFGGNFGADSTMQIRLGGADTLEGTTGADRMVGGGGNDTFTGGGGEDAIHGGAGDDTITVADALFLKVDGGSGSNTLVLSGSGITLDLSALGPGLRNIQTIDLGGGGNTLVLTAASMSMLVGTPTPATEGRTLTVTGGSGDAVQGGSGWATGTAEAGYAVFTHGNLILRIADAVDSSAVTAGLFPAADGLIARLVPEVLRQPESFPGAPGTVFPAEQETHAELATFSFSKAVLRRPTAKILGHVYFPTDRPDSTLQGRHALVLREGRIELGRL